jgi:desulfoferrodoxin-like iron-binding protein
VSYGSWEVREKYRCSICGNEVMVLTVGGGELECCGELMDQIIEE